MIVAKRGQKLQQRLGWPKILTNRRASQRERCALAHFRQCHSGQSPFAVASPPDGGGVM